MDLLLYLVISKSKMNYQSHLLNLKDKKNLQDEKKKIPKQVK